MEKNFVSSFKGLKKISIGNVYDIEKSVIDEIISLSDIEEINLNFGSKDIDLTVLNKLKNLRILNLQDYEGKIDIKWIELFKNIEFKKPTS